MRPLLRVVLVPSTPMKEDRLSTAGSCRMTLASSCWRSRHAVEGDRLRRLGDAQDHAGVLDREEAFGDDDVEQDGRARVPTATKRRRLVLAARSSASGRRSRSSARSLSRRAGGRGSARLRAGAAGSWTHIIGVRVSEMMADMMIVTARVTANSRNRRPTMSPMNSSGISTAISETVSETMVKPISLGALERRLQRRFALLDVARDVLDHDDGVVDDEAGGDGQRHQREVVQAVAEQVHDARRCRSATAAPRCPG